MIAQVKWEQEAGDPSMEPVLVLLQRMDEAGLIELARELGYSFIPAVSQRAELVSYIETRLTDPGYIELAVRTLDPQAMQLWRWLTQHLLPARPDDVRAALGFSSTDLRTAVHAMARRGLLWRGYGNTDGDKGLRLVIPDVIRFPTRPEPSPPPDLVEIDASQVATSDWIHPDALAWDLLTLLRERMNRSVARLGNDAGQGAASSRRTNPRYWRGLSGPPPTGYLAFLGYLAAGLGLVMDRDTPAPVGERLTHWTRLSFEEQTHRMIDLWRNAAEWFEGATLESFHAWGADWPGLRRALLSSLAELGEDRWFTLDSFARRFAASHPAALGAHVTVAVVHEPVDVPATSRQQGAVRRATEITVMTACAWLGLVELVGVPKGPLLMRVTRLGSLIAAGTQAEAEEPAREAPPLSMHPNFDILLLTPSSRRVWALSAFADLSHLDRVSIYRLTEQSVLRSLEAGVSVRNVVRFLEHQNGSPLPQNVAYALHEWEQRHRIVGIRASLLLDVDGEPAAGEIERILREHSISAERLPGDRLLVSLPQGGDVAAFVERIARILREAGHIPRILRNL
jgi:DNA-binding transcriptional ArsR family regulator